MLASLQSLRSAWLKARTSEQRRAICEAVETSFKQPKKRGSTRPAREVAKERALFERRMLVLAAHPATLRNKLNRVEFDWVQGGIWYELRSSNSRPFVSLLKKHLRSKVLCIRAEAAEHLAEFGTNELAPFVARLLRDKDASVVRSAAEGTRSAASCNLLSRRAGSKIFDQLALIATGKRTLPTTWGGEVAIGMACEALIAIDAKRAIGLLSSSACLRPNNRSILKVVLTLRFELENSERPTLLRKPIDPQLLWPLFDRARSGTYYRIKGDGLTSHQRAMQIACSILLLTADGDPIRTREECLAIIKSKKSGVGNIDDAKAALRRCNKIPDPSVVADRFSKRPGSFRPAAANILQALELANHVNTDGLHLYFINLGLHQASALEGLKAMKLTATASLFRKAAKLVGPRGADKSMTVREAAIDALPESTQSALFKIEDQFDKHCQLIFKAVDRAITQNPDLFRPVRK